MPIVLDSEFSPYGDTPAPKRFGTVSPLDPQLFSSIEEHCQELLSGRKSGKYSPIEVAQWLQEFAAKANQRLAAARKRVTSAKAPEFGRAEEDVYIQIGLGQFFAAKLRSGVLFEIYLQTKDPAAGEQALTYYRQAREVWAAMAQRAQSVYVPDITYGSTAYRRGHWIDRLPAIDKDIEALQATLKGDAQGHSATTARAEEAIREATGHPHRPAIECTHIPPRVFTPGEAMPVSIRFGEGTAREAPSAVRLLYRHVNHAERWKTLDMKNENAK